VKPENVRITVAALSLSFAAAVGIAVHEGYTTDAVIPTKGDVPTYGYGSTVKADGARVRMGERTDPVNALKTMHAHISREEARFRASLAGVHLTQGEYDVYMDWVYQYGMGAWHKPKSPRTWLLQGEHVAACDALLHWRFVGSYDCSTPGNRRCMGVWTRQQARHKACLEAQP
jgi:Phage-related lysozyme (muraminidase)